MANDPEQQQDNLLEAFLHDLDTSDMQALRNRLVELNPAEVADLLESMPEPERGRVWHELPEEVAGEALAEMGEVARAALVEELPSEEVIAAAQTMEVIDLAQVIDELPDPIGDAILESLPHEERERVEKQLAYPEESAGRLMRAELVAVRPDVSLETVLRYLRRREALPRNTDGLMVINREGTYLGKLSMSALLTSDPSRSVGELMEAGADRVSVDTPQSEVTHLFERRDLVSVAVVDPKEKLVGLITIDDVVDVIREQADRQLLNMVQLSEEEDLFAPVLPSTRRRALWLGINLATAFLASWVIGLFEATLAKVVALAVLMPIVASMGGIAGSQTLTLTIRGLALGQISAANTRWLAFKEIGVGLLNGLLWAVVVGAVAYVWFHDYHLGLIIAAAMITNLLVAAFSGLAIPLILRRLGIDPALSGAVVLTTVTDIIGFMTFLGLGTLFLL
jgi:magnesium transporter